MQEEDLPVLKSMPGRRLRRRFDRGMPVQVYLGAEQGFLTGTVVEPASGPEPRDIIPSPRPRRILSPEASPSTSPLCSSDDDDDDDDPHGVDVRSSAGTAEVETAVVPQRHATATVSIYGRSGPHRTYPEYMIRPLIERRGARSWKFGSIMSMSLFDRDEGHVLEDLDGPWGFSPQPSPRSGPESDQPLSYFWGFFSPQPSPRSEPESDPQLNAGQLNGGDV
ncbi:unnamed protein product [Prorocentrum cordatum]|uniref:Uncharacterized protein n=1 Tax=Prorocentrum cordatum TaxID=2364126 RepID=A0ABN9VGT3_9DINO|nr:unnamed protein product [Polarella glacialis]